MIKDLFKLFGTPSAFPNDPVGWAYSQIGHGYLGVCLTTITTWTLLKLSGSHPDETLIAVLVSLSYLIYWEIDLQGYRGWDTIEDSLFVAAGASLFIFIDMSEVIDRLMLWVIITGVSILSGIYRRLGE